MKFNLIFCIIICILFSSCKPNKRCHNSLEIKNVSPSKILLCKSIQYAGTDLYAIDVFAELESGETYKDKFGKSCIEKSFKASNPYNFYVVDPNKHSVEFYIKDSIYTKNKILKEYNLTGSDIKNSNFVITYP